MRTALAVGLGVLLALAWYLSFSASRLDRLHHRVEGARAMLDTQLVRRAEAAVELATSGLIDPAAGLLVASAASEALVLGERADDAEGVAASGALDVGDETDRETAESDLTRCLHDALDEQTVVALGESQAGRQLLTRLGSASHRVQLARRFHNQAVADTQRVRRKRVVRWAHLAGRAELPQTFEMDDDLPAAPDR